MLKTLYSISFDKNMPQGFGNFGAIYRIRNRVNGKFYIGSTINFKNRFYQHRSKVTRKVNSHLSFAVKKYGREKFSYELLENVDEKEKLTEREQFYINEYIKPLPFQSHYNVRIDDVSRSLNVELPTLRKKFTVRGPCGQIYEGHGTQKFCEEHVGNDGTPMHDSDFNAMLRGKTKHCKGWHLLETKPEDIYKHFRRRKSFTLENPEGELVEFQGIAEFEKKYGLTSVSNLLNPSKNIYCIKGWIVPGTDRSKLARRHYEEFTLKEISSGKLHTYENVSDFCSKFKIKDDNHITSVINGTRTSAHGFCLPETNIEETRKVTNHKFYIKDPEGKIFVGTEYKSFSAKHGLEYKSVSAIFQKNSGKLSHKGWEPSSEEDYIAQLNGAPLIPHTENKVRYWLGKKRYPETVQKIIHTKLAKQNLQGYLLSNTSGEIFFTDNLKEFAADFEVSYSCINRALYGGKEISDGWKRLLRGKKQWFVKFLKIGDEAPDTNFVLNTQLLEEISEFDRIAKKQIAENYYGWLLTKNGKESLVFNLSNYCKERKMHSSLLVKKSELGEEYKGYTVKKNTVIPKDLNAEVLELFKSRELYYFS